MSTSDDVRDILATALGRDEIDGQDDPSRATVERWDSLASLEIVFLLEEHFDRRFSEQEVARLGSLSEIVAVVSNT
jgi:acyl carrier protein